MVGDYIGWSLAVFEEQAQLKKLADGKGVFKRPISKLKKKTSVNFKSFTRSVNFQFLNDALELVSEATEKVDCKDITPR
jgi:ubiquinone biosynthesis protein UbiJ